jgi:transcriptional regulator with XRE-family HTH domain
MTSFGDYVRGLREKKEIGLREFCTSLEFDPSRWSKMERGLLQPPTDHEILEKIAKTLGISPDTDEFAKLRDLAFLSRGQIPDDILSEKELVECLPMIFRTLRSDEKPTPAQLRKLADKLRHN